MSKPTFFGIRVHVEPLRPRYTLPIDVPPPTDMTRDQFDEWSRRVCGYDEPIMPYGQVLKTPDGLHMNEATWDGLRSAIIKEGGTA